MRFWVSHIRTQLFQLKRNFFRAFLTSVSSPGSLWSVVQSVMHSSSLCLDPGERKRALAMKLSRVWASHMNNSSNQEFLWLSATPSVCTFKQNRMLCVSAGISGLRWNRDRCGCWLLLFCFIPFFLPSVTMYFMGGQGCTVTVCYSSFHYSWVTPLAYFTLKSPALNTRTPNTLCRWISLYVANWRLFSIRRRLTEAVHFR